MSSALKSAAVVNLDRFIDEDRREGSLQVSGLTNFPEERWREAILHYLFGVWGSKQEVMYRPKIAFGMLTLSLDQQDGEYFAYGLARDGEYPPELVWEEGLVVGCRQLEVEQGLIRFVKNDGIRSLNIALQNHGRIMLWKKERRGQYGSSASGIPSTLEAAFAMR